MQCRLLKNKVNSFRHITQNYTIFSDGLLRELFRIFNNKTIDEVGGDVIGRIYEYFLSKFAKAVA